MNRFLHTICMSMLKAAVTTAIVSAAMIFGLPSQSSASYRIGSNVTLRPSVQAVPGKQVFQTCITAGDTQWAYFIYLPATYDSNGTKKWPMLIFQEVAGAMYNSNGGKISDMYDSARSGMNGGPVYDLEKTPKPAYLADRFIVLAPYVNSQIVNWKSGGVPGRLMGLYKDIIKRFKVDTTHISMMGYCAGGGLVWGFAAAYPKFPSALALFAFNDTWCSTVDLTKACNLKDIPYQHYADQTDPMVPFANQTAIRDAITTCGGTKMQFIVQNKGQHESWGLSGLDTVKSMYDWMLANQTPTSVAPKANENQNIKVSMINLCAGDQIEVMDLNGQLLLKSHGGIADINRLLSEKGKGAQVVRFTRANQPSRQFILLKAARQ